MIKNLSYSLIIMISAFTACHLSQPIIDAPLSLFTIKTILNKVNLGHYWAYQFHLSVTLPINPILGFGHFLFYAPSVLVLFALLITGWIACYHLISRLKHRAYVIIVLSIVLLLPNIMLFVIFIIGTALSSKKHIHSFFTLAFPINLFFQFWREKKSILVIMLLLMATFGAYLFYHSHLPLQLEFRWLAYVNFISLLIVFALLTGITKKNIYQLFMTLLLGLISVELAMLSFISAKTYLRKVSKFSLIAVSIIFCILIKLIIYTQKSVRPIISNRNEIVISYDDISAIQFDWRKKVTILDLKKVDLALDSLINDRLKEHFIYEKTISDTILQRLKTKEHINLYIAKRQNPLTEERPYSKARRLIEWRKPLKTNIILY